MSCAQVEPASLLWAHGELVDARTRAVASLTASSTALFPPSRGWKEGQARPLLTSKHAWHSSKLASLLKANGEYSSTASTTCALYPRQGEEQGLHPHGHAP